MAGMNVTTSRTNGFLFADLRDYTRYLESHGDQAGAALLESYRRLVRAAVAQFGGAEIRTEGDSFYVVFPSASSAVQCGLAILDAAAGSADHPGAPIHVGIGVHAGETVETQEGYVGSAVNVAARVCSQARAGELLVTDTVRALTRTFLPVRFVDRRSRRLKGIAEPVVIYRVEPAGGTSTLATDAVTSRIRRRAVAVALLMCLIFAGVSTAYLLLAGQDPQAGVAASASPSPGNVSFPTADEADLLAKVPTQIRDRCVRADDESPARTTAVVRCDLELSAEADTVWYVRFESGQAMRDHLTAIAQAQHLQQGTCGPTVPRAQGTWQAGSTFSGRLLCYGTDSSTSIAWTYDADRILARAVRSGASPEVWSGLLSWWSQMRLFLR